MTPDRTSLSSYIRTEDLNMFFSPDPTSRNPSLAMIAQVRSFQTHPTRATEVKSTRKHVCCVRLEERASACVLTIPAHGLHRTTHPRRPCPVFGQLSVPILPTSALCCIHRPSVLHSQASHIKSSSSTGELVWVRFSYCFIKMMKTWEEKSDC